MPISSASDTIQIRVDEVSQLFNTLDPFPFRDRDLDRDAEDFIVGWARELPRHLPIRIVIHVSNLLTQKATAEELTQALDRYFAYRSETTTLELKEMFRVGRLSLVIGLAVLAACLILSGLAVRWFGDGEFGRYATEGLIIIGWVANWKPLEIFLYDWWPIAKRRNLYRRLSRASVEVSAGDMEAGETRSAVNASAPAT